MSSDTLRPCPFCGGDDVGVFPGMHEFDVMCFDNDCFARGPGLPTREQAIAAWNRRVCDAP